MPRLLAILLLAAAGPALAGSTVYSSGNGVAIVSGSGIAIGDVVVAKGPVKTEERRTAPYTGLVVEAPVEMTYAVAATSSLKVSAQENILPLVTTEVKGGRLVVGLKKSVSMDRPIRIEATGQSLAAIVLTSTGDIRAKGLAGRRLVVEITGSGSVAVAGQSDALSVDVSGSGTVDAAALASRDASVDVSGSGTVAVKASASVKVDLSGSGSVTVAGKPPKRSIERSGAGEVEFR